MSSRFKDTLIDWACLAAGLLLGWAITVAVGCCSRAVVADGTEFNLGVYLPMDGQLYGLQILRYRNGMAVVAPSNATVQLCREFAATNAYLGAVRTVEASTTEAEIGR